MSGAPNETSAGVAASVVLLIVIAAFVVALVFAISPTRGRFAASIALVVSGFVAGLAGTVLGLIVAFSAVGNAAPSEKASILSHGISAAMRSTGLGIVGVLAWLPPFTIGLVRADRRKRAAQSGRLTPAATSAAAPPPPPSPPPAV